MLQLLTLLPGNLWFVPELGRVLDELDVESALRASICNKGEEKTIKHPEQSLLQCRNYIKLSSL